MINWGIMGAGGIARVFCNAMRFSETGQVAAVASRTRERRESIAKDFSIPAQFDCYEALLADETVEAVYIATIHPLHVEWAVKAAAAGKHVLVEKPFAMNHAEAAAMIEAARTHDVFMMEAFMYRCHPQIQRMADLIQGGAIGRVKMIRSVFSYNAAFNPDSRGYAKKLGGGGILDVGCYPASMARRMAGAAAGKPFLDPVEVKGCGKVGPTGVDHYAAAVLKFENDIVAEIITGVECRMPIEAVAYGETGALSVKTPWLPSSPCRGAREPLPLDTMFPPATIEVLSYESGETEAVVVEADRDLFTYEADTVAEHLDKRQSPAMSWDDTLGNARLLDRWLAEVGVDYG
jgi:predicted dehydrogenase